MNYSNYTHNYSIYRQINIHKFVELVKLKMYNSNFKNTLKTKNIRAQYLTGIYLS